MFGQKSRICRRACPQEARTALGADRGLGGSAEGLGAILELPGSDLPGAGTSQSPGHSLHSPADLPGRSGRGVSEVSGASTFYMVEAEQPDVEAGPNTQATT